MKKNYKRIYGKEIFTKIYRNPLLEITKKWGDDPSLDYLPKVQDQLPLSLQDFYSSCNGIQLEWKAKEETGVDASGSIYLLSLEEMFKGDILDLEKLDYNWRINDDYSSPPPKLKGVFRILDLFDGKGMTGLFSKEPSTEQVYVYQSGVSFESLKVDFDGYFQLLCKSYGFFWWQQVIIHREYKTSHTKLGHDDFRDTMPLLFPDFNFDEFIELYESLKIVD